MVTPQGSSGERSRRIRMPRRTAFVLGLVVMCLVYPLIVLGLPWAISLLTPHYGWTEGKPALVNLLGLLPVAAGAAGLTWVFSVMLGQLSKFPAIVELELQEGEHLSSATSLVLITHGPFAYSRNPMFLSAGIVLLGWAIFYGSLPILLVTVAGWTTANFLKIPQEERGCEARIGEAYRAYKARVPRWIGLPRR